MRKSFLENKITLGLDGNLYNNKNNLNQKSRNFIGQFSLGYQLFKNMGLQLQWVILNTNAEGATTFTESTGNLGLQYQFNYKPKKKDPKTDQ